MSLIIEKIGKYNAQDWIDNFSLMEEILEQLRTDTDGKLIADQKGAIDGVASLNNEGKVVEIALDSEKLGGMTYAQVVDHFLTKDMYIINSLITRNSLGEIVPVVIGESRIVGRLTGGDLKDLTGAEVLPLVISKNLGWGTPTGISSKAAFDVNSVTLLELAKRVAELIKTLKTQNILGD